MYAISGILFSVAYFKIRPITKFGKASDIPNHFVKQKWPQVGSVSSVEPSQTGPLLRIKHRPPLNIFFASKKTLPVKIYGVNINSNGYSWLQTVTVDKRVKFIPLFKHPDYAECRVFLVHPTAGKAQIDLATALTTLGFAQVQPNLIKAVSDDTLNAYQKGLQNMQKKAKRNRSGMWAEIIPPPIWIIRMIKNASWKVIYNLLPMKKRLPELVR